MTNAKIDYMCFAKYLVKHYGLMEWDVTVDRSKTCAGRCSYGKKTIYISKHYLQTASDFDIKDTILHEIAHALTPGHGHDDHWKSKAIDIGCSGDVYCDTFVKKRYHVTCECRAVNMHRHRIRKWVRERGECPKCYSRVTVKDHERDVEGSDES